MGNAAGIHVRPRLRLHAEDFAAVQGHLHHASLVRLTTCMCSVAAAAWAASSASAASRRNATEVRACRAAGRGAVPPGRYLLVRLCSSAMNRYPEYQVRPAASATARGVETPLTCGKHPQTGAIQQTPRHRFQIAKVNRHPISHQFHECPDAGAVDVSRLYENGYTAFRMKRSQYI